VSGAANGTVGGDGRRDRRSAPRNWRRVRGGEIAVTNIARRLRKLEAGIVDCNGLIRL
jgi:hypothetical protein